jgi:hypothetical protein
MPAQPHVHLTYEKHATLPAYLGSIHRHYQSQDADFMDGIIHAPDEHVLSIGRFTRDPPYAHRYDWVRAYPESTRSRAEDYLRTADYFFRYDRGVTRTRPRTFLGRLLFGKLMGSSRVLGLANRLHWLMRSPSPTVIVDVFVPFSQAEAFMAWYREALGYFPLWCVPYRVDRPYPWLSDQFVAAMKDHLYLDIAIYGMKPPPGKNPYRMLEEKLLELGGLKTLISHNFYSEEEFWRTWNLGHYQAAKARTDPDNLFRGLYEKMCRATQGLEG